MKSPEEIRRIVEKAMQDAPYMEQVSPGLWKISSGGKNPMIMYTGDGGAEEFRKAFREQVKNFNADGLHR